MSNRPHLLMQDVERAVALQDFLFNIEERDLGDAVDFVVANGYLDSQDLTYALLGDLLRAIECRPLNIELFVDFTISVCAHKPTFAHLLLREVFRPVRKSRLCFVFTGLTKGLFQIQTIMSLVKTVEPDDVLEAELFNTIAWFAPELEKYDPQGYKSVISRFKGESFEFLKNTEEIRLLRAPGVRRMTMVEALRRDDCECVKKMLEAKEISTDSAIPSYLFEPFDLLSENLSVLAYCAYFDAVQCFTFLLSKGASLDTGSGVSVVEAAVAGGAMRVMPVLGDRLFTLEAVSAAVRYHRNLVYECISDNIMEDMYLLNDCCQANNLEIAVERIKEETVTADDVVLAAKNGCCELLGLLCSNLRREDILNQTSENGELALVVAARESQVAALRLLLKAGADIDAQSGGENSPIYSAVSNDCLEGVKLLAPGCDEQRLHKSFSLAAEREFVDTAKMILGTGKLKLSNTEECVSQLMSVGAFDTYREIGGSEQDISLAIRQDSLEFFSFLFDKYQPADKMKLLKECVTFDADECARYLLSRSELRKGDAEALVFECIKNKSKRMLRVICGDCWFDINSQNEDGYTPLMVALQNNMETVALFLLSSFANEIDINIIGNDGETAFTLARTHNCAHAFSEIAYHERFSCSNLSKEDASTLFLMSAANNDLDLMKRVYSDAKEIDPNIKTGRGDTAFSLAMAHDNKAMSAFLSEIPGLKITFDVIKNGSEDVLIKALQMGNIDPNELVGMTRMFVWAQQNGKNKFALAIARHPDFDPNPTMGSPLGESITNGNRDLFDALLSHPSIDVNKPGMESPLSLAMGREDRYYFDKLMEHPGLDVNSKVMGKSSILSAVEKGQLYCLQRLLARDDIVLTDLGSFIATPYSAAQALVKKDPQNPDYQAILALLEEKGITEVKQSWAPGSQTTQSNNTHRAGHGSSRPARNQSKTTVDPFVGVNLFGQGFANSDSSKAPGFSNPFGSGSLLSPGWGQDKPAGGGFGGSGVVGQGFAKSDSSKSPGFPNPFGSGGVLAPGWGQDKPAGGGFGGKPSQQATSGNLWFPGLSFPPPDPNKKPQ